MIDMGALCCFFCVGDSSYSHPVCRCHDRKSEDSGTRS